MSEKYQNDLLLTIKTSKRVRGLVILIHAIAVCAGLATTLDIAIKLCLCLAISMHGWLILRRLHAEQYKIKYTEAMGWEIAKNCDFVRVDILKSTVITTFALFLHFKFATHSQLWNSKFINSLLISSDSLGEQDYRWLIVKLKTTVAK